MKLYVQYVPDHVQWLEPYAMQGIVNWGFCVIVCVIVSLSTSTPRPEQVTDQLTFNWRVLDIFREPESPWYVRVSLWWAIFVALIMGLVVIFSGWFL